MSNENSASNSPRYRRRIVSTGSSGRSRRFSCITYLNELQLQVCLMKHSNQIRAYAYAYHDKDKKDDGTLKEPHCHLILGLYNTCSVSSIRRWFGGYMDEKEMPITTTAQICGDVYTMYDYLTHSTKEAIEDGKYRYDKSIIVCNNKDYFQAGEQSEYDNITLATEMLLKGAKTRELGRRFGRDFILHYGAIKQYLSDIYQWEMHPEYKDVGDILENEWVQKSEITTERYYPNEKD